MLLENRISIWGAGERGRSLLEAIGEENVNVFIDSDAEKQRKTCCGKSVLSFRNYVENFGKKQPIIVSSFFWEKIIVEELKSNGIDFCFRLSEEPSELQGYGVNYPWKYLDISKIMHHDKIIIVGTTLYAYCVYRYLLMNGYNEVYLYTQKEGKKRWLKNNLNCSFIDTIDKKKDIVWLASREEFYNDQKMLNMIDIYDLSLFVQKYENMDLRRFKGLHKGEECLIVANGPSLNTDDLQKVHGIKTFGVNRIYKIEEKWLPDYYVCADRTMFMDDEVYRYKAKIKFFSEMYYRYSCGGKITGDVYTTHVVSTTYTGADIPFSEDISKCIYAGNTVVYACIQIAVYMGFRKIYLVGVDCDYLKGRNNHFYGEDLNDDGDQWQEISINAYKSAKKYADAHGIKIYNATRGGKLEVFERVDFDSLDFVKSKIETEEE